MKPAKPGGYHSALKSTCKEESALWQGYSPSQRHQTSPQLVGIRKLGFPSVWGVRPTTGKAPTFENGLCRLLLRSPSRALYMPRRCRVRVLEYTEVKAIPKICPVRISLREVVRPAPDSNKQNGLLRRSYLFSKPSSQTELFTFLLLKCAQLYCAQCISGQGGISVYLTSGTLLNPHTLPTANGQHTYHPRFVIAIVSPSSHSCACRYLGRPLV